MANDAFTVIPNMAELYMNGVSVVAQGLQNTNETIVDLAFQTNFTSGRGVATGEYYLAYGPTGYRSAPLILVNPAGDILYSTWGGSNTLKIVDNRLRQYADDVTTWLDTVNYVYDYRVKGGPMPIGVHDTTGDFTPRMVRPNIKGQYPWSVQFGGDDRGLWDRVGANVREYCRIHGSGTKTKTNEAFYTAATPGTRIGYPTWGCIRVDNKELERLKNTVDQKVGGASKIKKFIVTHNQLPIDPNLIGLDKIAPNKVVGYIDDRITVPA